MVGLGRARLLGTPTSASSFRCRRGRRRSQEPRQPRPPFVERCHDGLKTRAIRSTIRTLPDRAIRGSWHGRWQDAGKDHLESAAACGGFVWGSAVIDRGGGGDGKDQYAGASRGVSDRNGGESFTNSVADVYPPCR